MSRGSVDYTFAMPEDEFQSFVRDDGVLDAIECGALCDCMAARSSSTPTDAAALEDTGERGTGGGSKTSGDGGPRCAAPSDRPLRHWDSCTYRNPAGGYRLVRCFGTQVVSYCK